MKFGSEIVFFGSVIVCFREEVGNVGWLLDKVVSNVQFVSFNKFLVASGSSKV